MKLRSLFGFGIVLTGYLLMWWGWAQYRQTPTPLSDLIVPSHAAKLAGDLTSTSSAQAAANAVIQGGPGSVQGALAQGGLPGSVLTPPGQITNPGGSVLGSFGG